MEGRKVRLFLEGRTGTCGTLGGEVSSRGVCWMREIARKLVAKLGGENEVLTGWGQGGKGDETVSSSFFRCFLPDRFHRYH